MGGKLLFREFWLIYVSHDELVKDVVSIPGLLRIGTICKVVNSLSRKSRMSLASHKGKGKRMANQLEETGWGTRAQNKALWESCIF